MKHGICPVCVISDSCFWAELKSVLVGYTLSKCQPQETRLKCEYKVCVCESTGLQTFTLVHLSLHEPLFKSVGSMLVQKLWLVFMRVLLCVFMSAESVRTRSVSREEEKQWNDGVMNKWGQERWEERRKRNADADRSVVTALWANYTRLRANFSRTAQSYSQLKTV